MHETWALNEESWARLPVAIHHVVYIKCPVGTECCMQRNMTWLSQVGRQHRVLIQGNCAAKDVHWSLAAKILTEFSWDSVDRTLLSVDSCDWHCTLELRLQQSLVVRKV